MRKILILFLLLCSATPVFAKGGLVLEGIISQVKGGPDDLSFLFTGTITFSIYGTNYGDVKQTLEGGSRKLVWDVQKIPVHVRRWKSPDDSMTPPQRPYSITFDNAVYFATKRAKDDKMSIEIMQPTISFNDPGDIRSIEGTAIFVNPKN